MAMAMKLTAKMALTAPWGLKGLMMCSTLSSSLPFTLPPLADGAESNKRPQNDPSTNLFISGLNKRTTSDGLKNFASEFGQVVSARVVTDRVTGYSKGFGFVNYASLEDSEKGVKGMDAKFLDGWVIFAEYARPRPELPQNNSGTFQSRSY